ncbi:MAG: hypothetical protein A2W11_11680 [Ignavibacteria bacterium RBG_16_35_7]|nr:MAG: hypothetical protein A2W11_11680 [Ignavibacteria bacterium RBG_16_35_7]
MITENLELDFKQRLIDLEVEINNPKFNYVNQLKGLDRIEEFLKGELDFWKNIKNKNQYITNYEQHYERLLRELQNFFNNNQRADNNSFKTNWNAINKRINSNITNDSFFILYSKTQAAQFIIDLMQQNQNQGYAAHSFIIDRQVDFREPNHFIGYLKAYDFLGDELKEDIKKETNQKVFNDLLNEIRNKLNDVDNQYKGTTNNLTKSKNDFITKLEEWEKNKTKEVDDYLSKQKGEFTSLFNLYTVKLKLEGPVIHWQNRVKKYKTDGIIWTVLLSIVIISSVGLFIWLMYNPPEAFKSNLFGGDPSALKAVLILAAIISFAVFLIRIFSKMVYSSFHLMRDSEEREQLTMVYLALVKEGKIDPTDRKLVFEALFSRADTGLLGGDSSPTMPGGLTNIIDKLSGK